MRKGAVLSADGETATGTTCSMASAADSPDLISGGKRRRRQRPAAMVATAIVFAAAIVLVVSCSVLATTSRHQRAMTVWRWKRRLQLKARMLLRRGSTLKRTSTNHRQLQGPRPWYETGSPGYDSIRGYPCYRTVEGTFATMDDMVEQYPNLAQVSTIGQSYLGEDIRVLKLTNSESPIPDRRRGKMVALFGVHSRELGPPELGVRFAEWLLDGFDKDADRTWVLDYNVIHLLLIANPDGRMITEDNPEAYHRKNGNDKNNNGRRCSGEFRQSGVDLNRNYAFMWGLDDGSSSNPCDETYRGPRPQSEPETRAIVKLGRKVFPRGQRRKRAESKYFRPLVSRSKGIFVDVHSFGNLLVFPWSWTRNERVPGANWDAYQQLTGKLSNYNGYDPSASGLSTFMYETSGDSVDYFHGKVGVASVLFEIGDAFLQDCDTFDSTIVGDNIPALFYAAKVSRNPLKTPGGIDVKKVTFDSSGQTLFVTIEMEGPNVFSLVADEIMLFIDSHPYDRPTPKYELMSPTIPSRAAGRVDTTNLAAGRHTACIQVKDRQSVAGAVTCAYFDVRPTANKEASHRHSQRFVN